jgi:hypothetical protein
LEELEDRESGLTEIFFNPDGTIKIGVTDGPLFKEGRGEWKLDEATGSFKMSMSRKFETGRNSKNPTDMGEFAFTVERAYTGTMTAVGGLLAFEGVMHAIDETFGDFQVGLFEMIDTTEMRELLTDEEAADKMLSGRTQKSN